MDTRTALLAAAAALLLAGAVGAVAAPDAIVDPREADERPGDVRIVDTVVSPGEVRGETAELRLGVDLRHRGSAVENVTVRHRAIGADSGLLVDETTVDVGTVDGGGERTINGSVDVEREGGYRIETVVFADGERRASQTTRVGGVAALTPDYADSRVGFTESNVWPTVAVSVSEADNQTATLSVSLSVTNRGDAVSEPLDLRVLLRQSESNVIADEASETVGEVRPGRTDTVTTTVEVPANYNYYVDAALWSDDVLIDETQGVANLNPGRGSPRTRRSKKWSSPSRTSREGATTRRTSPTLPIGVRTARAPETRRPASGPAALVALVAAILVARRRP